MKTNLTEILLLAWTLLFIMAGAAVAAETAQPGKTEEQKTQKEARLFPRFSVLPGTRSLVLYAAGGEKYTLRCGTWRRARKADEAKIKILPSR